MPRLSSPLTDLNPYYDVVVVGSGYGGAIAAARLTRVRIDGKPLSVCVLERGREFQPGDFPDTLSRAWRETQLDTPSLRFHPSTALYDFRINRDINVLVGCGLGGTSLINANVVLCPEIDVLKDERWPRQFRDDVPRGLLQGFRRAATMLMPTTYPEDRPVLRKLEALKRTADSFIPRDESNGFFRPPLAVSFTQGRNRAGVEQGACSLCGNCVSGCNYEGAKNTVATNYLPDAKKGHAQIFTQVGVRWVEKLTTNAQDPCCWRVHFELLDAGRERFGAPGMSVRAKFVILGGGTLGSTEILLRSQDHGLDVSDRLGYSFSGNGDVLGLAYNVTDRIHGVGFGRRVMPGEPVGPCISGVIDLRGQGQFDSGMVIEEGSIPGALAGLLPGALGAAALLYGGKSGTSTSHSFREEISRMFRYLRGPRRGAVEGTQILLVMSHDGAGGRMYLEDDRLRIDWPDIKDLPFFAAANRQLGNAAKELGGTYLQNPFNPITVHPLGGCPMGEDVDRGVVDHDGQVFDTKGEHHKGLYVCDASVIPRSLGVNPLFTISAIAERTCALLAAGLRSGVIPYP